MGPYFAVFLAGARRAFNRPGTLFSTALFYLLILFVFSALWAAATNGGTGEVAGYSLAAILWYLVATEAAVFPAPSRHIEEIGTSITEGQIEAELLRPVSVLGARMANELGGAFPQFVVCMVSGSVLMFALIGPPPQVLTWLLALPAALLAIAVNYAGMHVCGAAAFWLRDSRAVWFLYQKLVFLLGGMLLPLQFLPSIVQQWALWSPFAAMAYVPGRIMAGHWEPHLILLQLGWLVVLGGLANWCFARGQRRLAVGS